MTPKEKAEQIVDKYRCYFRGDLIDDIANALKEASNKDTERLDFLGEEMIKSGELLTLMTMYSKYSLNADKWHDSLRDAIDAEMKDNKREKSQCAEIEIKGYDKEIESTDFVKLNGKLYKRQGI